ncbi:PTS transporter subunit EIIB [Streptomyces sp. SLBN-118]|uniref:PTS transporter subunit EIIB n=1 Tax=Streptomyces sp. SLBN-118 TaxID=2768454 RepID=UPI0037D99FA4
MSKTRLIVEELGGVDNVADIEACISRLRTEVNDADARRRRGPQEGRSSQGPRRGLHRAGRRRPEAECLAEDIKEML